MSVNDSLSSFQDKALSREAALSRSPWIGGYGTVHEAAS